MVSRKNYIHNLYPMFIQPKSKNKRPAFIRYAIKKASQVDVARSEINYTTQPINPVTGNILPRFRRLNEHRARAMRAMVQAMLYHFNISSELVMASIETLSDECGLSTISKAGNKSITRASRLITEFMEPMGYVTCEKIWDRIMGTYIPKIITLTPLFFMLFGISKFKLDQVKKRQLNWINEKRVKKGEFSITLMEIRREAKEQYIRKIFQYRKSKYIIKKQKKEAKKIIKLEEKIARQYILNGLVKRYSIEELVKMGSIELKKQVNFEYFRLRKIANNITT
ncbi:plasmid replication initiator RepA [Buchnera aphidicola]|uniref:plasmid replication initiator RepA n=1 Tax=Buchnera aphidicola TaxID=9 RepID=UPI003463D0A2